jgi:hypothetical protein
MKPLLASLLMAVCLFPLQALAALGGDVSSIAADRAQFNGSIALRQGTVFNVHQIKADNGTVVREFVSPSGSVFAVSWSGPFVPNLHQLLGTYFDQYSAGVTTQKSTYVGRHPLDLKSADLAVEMHGHMRAYYGRAYLPQQIPAGTNVGDLW